MFWVISLAVIIIGTPLLLFALASLAAEIGLGLTVSVSLVLVVIAGAVSLPSALSLIGTGVIVYIVYRLLNKTSPTPDQ